MSEAIDDYNHEIQEILKESNTLLEEVIHSQTKKVKLDQLRARIKRGNDAVKGLSIELRFDNHDSNTLKDKVKEYQSSLDMLGCRVSAIEKGESQINNADQTTDAILRKVENVQSGSLSVINSINNQLDQTISLGNDTLTEMNNQTDIINHSIIVVEEVEDDMSIARKQIRSIIRRIMTDKMIWVLILLIVVTIAIAIIYVVVKNVIKNDTSDIYDQS